MASLLSAECRSVGSKLLKFLDIGRDWCIYYIYVHTYTAVIDIDFVPFPDTHRPRPKSFRGAIQTRREGVLASTEMQKA